MSSGRPRILENTFLPAQTALHHGGVPQKLHWPGPARHGPARPQPQVDEKWEGAKLPHMSFRRNPEYQMEEGLGRKSRPCHESSGICTGSVHEGARVLVIASGIHSVDHIP